MNNPIKSASKKKIKRIIKELSNNASLKYSIADLRKKIDILWEGYTQTSPILPARQPLYRGIIYKEKPKNIHQLSYPPAKITKLGRANFANQPMFYASGDPRTTFFEIGAKIGDFVALSMWRTAEELLLCQIGYMNEVFETLHSNRKCPVIVDPKYMHPNEIRYKNRSIHEFFNKEFTKIIKGGNESLYLISTLIAEKFLQVRPNSCGLAYPSIAMHANAENIALRPAFVDQHLRFKNIMWCRVDKVQGFEYTITRLAYTDKYNSNGDIIWT